MNRFILFLLLSALPISASVNWILGAGNQSPFATELHITNIGSTSANLQISFVPTGATPTPPVTTTLGAGATTSFTDALNQLFSLTGASGAIRISADQPVLISAARHTSATGTNLPIIAEEDFLGSGNIGDALWVSESGDPTFGFTTRFQVYLADASVSTELRIYDSAGNLVVTNPVAGGPGLTEIATPSLLSGPLLIGRAELRVTNGRAAGWVELRDNVTGDPMSMAFAGPGSDSTSLIVNSVRNEVTASGAPLRTDLRLFNPTPTDANVTIFDTIGDSATLTLAPKSLQEVVDVAALIKASTPGPLAVQVNTFGNSILVASRTAAVAQVGSPGILGEIHQTPPFDPSFPPQVVTYLYGLPSGNPVGSIVARSAAGGAYQAVLLDGAGNMLSTPAPVSVPASGVVQSALSDLLGGVTVPDGAQLQLTVITGAVEAALIQTAPKPFYQEAAPPPSVGCALPAIGVLTASQLSLSSAGNVTISWQATDADSVDLAPAATGLAASGSIAVAVPQSTTFQLIAYNSCGQTATPIPISVGPPSPTTVSVLTGAGAGSTSDSASASAQPGDLLSIAVSNIADPSLIDGVVFQASDGSVRVVDPDSVDDYGTVNVRVPMWGSNAAPTGYVTGNVTVAITAGGDPIGTLPLTIKPLSYTGDPIAAFQTIIDGISSAAADFNNFLGTPMTGAPDLTATIAAQQAHSALFETALRQMLSDVASKGSATLYWGSEPPTPDAVSVTVTMADITNMAAYNYNLLQSPVLVSSLRPKARLEPRDLNPLNCLKFRWPWSLAPECKALKVGQQLGKQMQDYLGLFDSDEILADAKSQAQGALNKLLAKTAAGAALKKLKSWISFLEALCLVEPIQLQNFSVVPLKFPNVGKSNTSTTTMLFANMVSALSNQDLVDKLEKAEADNFLKKQTKGKKLSKDDYAEAEAFLIKMLNDSNSGFDSAVTDVVRTISGATPTSHPQVGTCDLAHFYPKKNGPDNHFMRGNWLESGYVSPQGDLNFYYIGRRDGNETFCIDPQPLSFLFPDDLELTNKLNYSNSKDSCRYMSNVHVGKLIGKKPLVQIIPPQTPVDSSDPQYSQNVTIGDTTPILEIAASQVFTEYQDLDSGDTDSSLDGYSSPVGAALFEPPPDTRTVTTGNATSTVTTTQTGENSWTATISTNYIYMPDPMDSTMIGAYWDGTAMLWLKFTNPINRDNNQSVHVQVQPDPNCQGGFVSGASAQDIQGNLTTQMCPAPMNCQQTSSPPSWTFDNTGAVAGNISVNITAGNNAAPGNSGGCTVTVNIQMTR